MTAVYFSGTGNSRFCAQTFVRDFTDAKIVSVEEAAVREAINADDEFVFAFPIYYSSLPKLVHDFLTEHGARFNGKRVFVIATMGLFSGDGAGCAARLLRKRGARITGGLHVKMPDCIGDVALLKKSDAQNKRIVNEAQASVAKAAERYRAGHAPKQGLSFLSRITGLLGQRLWFGRKTKRYSDGLKVDREKCVGCGLCVRLCPMQNILLSEKAVPGKKCTMCYRCVNFCPQQALTLLGKAVVDQIRIEKYIGE